ncbi:MAG: ADP-ribosylation factor-directed GTPase activating protein isoform b [Planctomycetia bacterium]|nr:ADP-ribosylation factor-directed GTPase activating protein isoform b [Planctomycetia bacterium]
MHRCKPSASIAILLALAWLLLLPSCEDAPRPTTVIPPDDELKTKLDDVVRFTGDRVMNTRDHAAWQIVHGILAYKRDLKIDHEGQVVSALDFILAGNGEKIRGFNLRQGSHGLDSLLEPGSLSGQGHDDQWLGYLSTCGLKGDTKLIWQGRTYTLADLVSQAQWDVRENADASWTFIGLGTYLPLDAKWTSSDGREWSLEKMIEIEIRQDVNDSACGGTHRLGFLALMLQKYGKEKAELTGPWLEAEELIRRHVELARTQQNPDGTFSTSFFARPGNSPELTDRIRTTGHIVEFLSIALDDEELEAEWVKRGVTKLCKMLEQTKGVSVECGALYHAANGLMIYRQRRFGAMATDEPPAPSQQQPTTDAPPPPGEVLSGGAK